MLLIMQSKTHLAKQSFFRAYVDPISSWTVTLQADVLFVLYIPHFTCITPCVLTVQQL
jgi:hypothetical protein